MRLWIDSDMQTCVTPNLLVVSVGVSRQNLGELTPISEQDTVDTHRSPEPKKKQKSEVAGMSVFLWCNVLFKVVVFVSVRFIFNQLKVFCRRSGNLSQPNGN